jgi:hypothetical protein
MKTPAISPVAWKSKNGAQSIDIFGIGTDNVGYISRWYGTNWGDWQNLLQTFVSVLTGASFWNDRIDVFGLNPFNRMMHKAWDVDQWIPEDNWELIGGGTLSTEAAIASSGKDQLEIFALGKDNMMRHTYTVTPTALASSMNTNWHTIKQEYFSSPPAATYDGKRTHVVALGKDNRLLHNSSTNSLDPNAWGNWKDLEKTLLSRPTIVSSVPGEMEIFVLDENNKMLFWHGNGLESVNQTKQAWIPLGHEQFTSPPAAVSSDPGRIDVFGLNRQNIMLHKARVGNSWDPADPAQWQNIGGVFSSPPAAISWGPKRVDIFGLSTDNQLRHKTLENDQFLPDVLGWQPLGGGFTHP